MKLNEIRKLETIQTKENLNEVFSIDERDQEEQIMSIILF